VDTQNIQPTESDKGFTLIELLIVIVILGVLATITVFAVNGITNRGQQSACAADLKTVEVAVEAYYAKNGTYPTTLAQLTAEPDRFLKSAPDTVSLGTDGEVTPAGTCA
jgi:general secretion pathway protein G